MYIVLIIAAALAGWLLIWNAVVGLISVIGGWNELSKTHPLSGRSMPGGRSFSLQSVNLSFFGNYRSVITVTVFAEGIGLKPLFVYRFLHRPIYIESARMSDVVFGKYFLFPSVTFRLGMKKIRITGKSVEAIKETLRAA